MKMFLAADGSAGLKVAKAIAAEGHTLCGVAAPETEANRALLRYCDSVGGIRFRETIVERSYLVNWIKFHEVDVVLSIHTSHIMSDEFLSAPRVGSFNLHPGPLPYYAGRNPVSWAIYNGERTHGATLHRITPKIDAGAIIAQSTFDIDPSDTGLTLMAKTSTSGVGLVRDFLKKLAAGEVIEETEQDSSKRRYFNSRVPHDGRIDWTRTAEQIVNFVRASDFGPFPSPWGYPWFEVGGKTYRIVKAEVSELDAEANPGSVYDIGDVPLVNAADKFVRLLETLPSDIT